MAVFLLILISGVAMSAAASDDLRPDNPPATLFGSPEDFQPVEPEVATRSPQATPRLRTPQRDQVEVRWLALEQMLPEDHQARLVWAYVCGFDLSPILQSIKAVSGQAGRDANDPRLLFALWLYATIDGVGSGRQLEQLCTESLPYQWLCGGVSVNYHSLNDFRVAHGDLLQRLLVHGVATLLHQGLVELTRVAQDGLRVRASAGKASFRRIPTLRRCLEQAEAQVQALQQQDDETAPAAAQRQQQARTQAAVDRLQRVHKALEHAHKLQDRHEEIEQTKGVKKKQPPRASTTDPEARTMKMPDGGFRPAYNVQVATATAGGLIVGIDVTNQGSDSGQMSPMIEQVQQSYQQTPEEWLVDGGFATLEDIRNAEATYGTKVYAPVKDEEKKLAAGQDPYQPRRTDKPEVAAWRVRMGTAEAKLIYRERASVAEWSNAGMRQRGLYLVQVRGLQKVRCVALWQALAHNLLRGTALQQQAAQEEQVQE